MKTKNKILALLEIAIVLCSLFLVAIPAIAAEQTTHEVSASEVTTASEDEYVLGIYGNANEDDTIDMRDVTYTKLVIFGKKDETELADAYYDDEVDVLDVVQIKLIILGRESELTIVDGFDRIVTVSMPVERIVITHYMDASIIKALEAEDKVVGVASAVTEHETLLPELSQLPSIGSTWSPDAEKVIALEPDLVIALGTAAKPLAEQLEPVGIPLIGIYCIDLSVYEEVVKKRAYLLGKKDKADEYIDWYQGYLDIIDERVEGLSEEDKPRVLFIAGGPGRWYVLGSDLVAYHLLFEMAGGISISKEVPGICIEVDPEWVIDQNPEMVLLRTGYPQAGYDADDPSEMIATRDEFMSRPGVEVMDAVKEGEVYVTTYDVMDNALFVGFAYCAKWFHPELFEDLDPNAIHQEWLTRFQRLDYDLDEHGTFMYHPVYNPEGR